MHVTQYSHNFAVTGYNRYGYEFLKHFGISNFGEVDLRAVKINRMQARFRQKPLPTIKKTYAVSTRNGREFRFHINCLDMFKEAVSKDEGLRDKVTYSVEPMYVPDKVDLKVLPKYVPREDQIPLIGYLESPGNSKILNLRTGGGKAMPVTTPVLTPDGWRPIGDIAVGDLVISVDGKSTKVLGVYPQGKRRQCLVKFKDGREIECDLEHLWSVSSDQETWLTVDTKTAMSYLTEVGGNLYIPLMSPWVGRPFLPDSLSKFKDILDAPIGVRIALFDAFMSRHRKDRRYNREYADEIVYLARSLGKVAYSRECREVTYGGTEPGHPKTVTYSYSLIEIYEEDNLQIVSITETDDCEESVCIAVDHPSRLYVAKDFIVTHNTYCSLKAAADIGERIVVSVETKFFNLWQEALSPDSDKQILDLTKDEVLYVSGSAHLKALIQLGLRNELSDIKVIVVSLRTLANYFDTYLRFGEDAKSVYSVLPIDFFKTLRVGTIIKDELHLSLYANFVEELFTHAPRRFSLSATLEDGTFKDKVFSIMFPMDTRPDTGDFVRYIDVTALFYRFKSVQGMNYSNRGSTDYNHNQFEKWLIKDRNRLNNYLAMIADWVSSRYAAVLEPEQKCAIFVKSVDMATEVTKYLSKWFPHFKVSRYAASTGDVYDEAKLADILVTTDQSFGTGFDLEGLICCLMTSAIDAQNTNIQLMGRLRELKRWPHMTPVFDYLVCEDINRHVQYHENKLKYFKPRVKSHKVAYINKRI